MGELVWRIVGHRSEYQVPSLSIAVGSMSWAIKNNAYDSEPERGECHTDIR
jgi:hypothetical protein